MLSTANYWPIVINTLIQKYFAQLTTTCILQHPDFNIFLEPDTNSTVLLQINPHSVEPSFERDVYNFTQQDEYFNGNGIYYNNLVKRFIAAIKEGNCEGFLAFQEDIPVFAENFRKASLYSPWRSTNSRFMFAFVKDHQNEDYFQDFLFKNQANILVIEADSLNSSTFYLKTNKFVGSRSQHPEELILLSVFEAIDRTLTPDIDLFSNTKLRDLKGREIIVASLDYRPFVAIDFQSLPQYYDQSPVNLLHLVHVDGVETRLCLTFCELYNCTVQFDTSETEDWGVAYDNFTGTGLMGMVIEGKVDMTSGAVLAWDTNYMNFDVTQFLVRTGITCLVPAPRRIVSWDLPLKPFKPSLWLAIASVLLMESFFLLLARTFEKILSNSKQKPQWWSGYAFGFITAFKIFLNQSIKYTINANTLKVILIACYILDIIVTSVYGGGLASILTMPILEEAPDSVKGMYKHDLRWTATTDLWVESLKDVDDDPIIMRLYNNFIVHKYEDILEMAKAENFGFAIERLAFGHIGNLDFITPQALSHLKLMVDDVYYGYTVAMVSRLWAHLPLYNDLILNWHSSGLDKIWEWRITAKYLNINEQNQVITSRYYNYNTGPVALGMSNFSGIILLWLLGMCVSVVVFMGELVVDNFNQKRKKVMFRRNARMQRLLEFR